MEKVVIIGSGPAGLTAAIYCARAALNPIVLSGIQPGGQLTTTTMVENWPGFEHGVDGNQLMSQMQLQAENVGAKIVSSTVSEIKKIEGGFSVCIEDEKPIVTQTVIIATGASAITLPLPNKDKLMGYGLSTCAICDGFFYKNKKVAVVGGGDSAMEEATYLSKLASEVTLIHRSEKFRASKAMLDRVLSNNKIKVQMNTEVIEMLSNEQGLTGIVLKNKNAEIQKLNIDGLFMAIGHVPNTSFVKGLIDLDEQGYILTHNGTLTSVPGIFAAGDVEDKIYRQAVTSAGRGCQSALQVEKYLEHLN